ncbi:unnamed protein product [Ectocarpus sp. 8 AP-2014]
MMLGYLLRDITMRSHASHICFYVANIRLPTSCLPFATEQNPDNPKTLEHAVYHYHQHSYYIRVATIALTLNIRFLLLYRRPLTKLIYVDQRTLHVTNLFISPPRPDTSRYAGGQSDAPPRRLALP